MRAGITYLITATVVGNAVYLEDTISLREHFHCAADRAEHLPFASECARAGGTRANLQLLDRWVTSYWHGIFDEVFLATTVVDVYIYIITFSFCQYLRYNMQGTKRNINP